MESVFNTLNAVNVNAFTEKKDVGTGRPLTYLSWSNAWQEVKSRFADADYEIKKFGENNLPYVYDPNTGYMVFTSVTIGGIEHEMWLPVMDGANKAMKAEPYTYKTKYGEKTVAAATMFDINTAIMRCLTKNLAMFGLGLYIYMGEDIPQEEKDDEQKAKEAELKKPVSAAHIATIRKEMERTGTPESKVLYVAHCKKLEEMDIYGFQMVMKNFEKTPDKAV